MPIEQRESEWKVLVATQETQGSVEGDYSNTVDGELVYVQDLGYVEDLGNSQDAVCAGPEWGSDRGFAGVASAKATTTAMVVDLPGFTQDDMYGALVDSLERGGWLSGCVQEEVDDIVDDIMIDLEFLTGPSEVGTIIRRQAVLGGGEQYFTQAAGE